jgi:two-component system, NtrC family, sensor kinase
MGKTVLRTRIDEVELQRLLGLESSKIGFYSEVKQKICELKAANDGLRNKSNELQAVFDSIADSVVIYDHNGFVQYCNQVCSRLFSCGVATERHCSDFFHPKTRLAPFECPVERALAGERVELTFTANDTSGKQCYFDVTATTIKDVHPQKNRVLVFLRDITEKRMQELQLMQAEKLSSIGILAAGVAHEINNPLNSVAGYAEALLRRLRDEESLASDPRLEDFSKYLKVIIRESYRCKGTIECLLSFSRKSDGTVGKVYINEVVQEILELVRHKSRYEKITISTDLQADLPVVIGDPAGLRQVFMNLFMNAHQSIEASGKVEIVTSQADAETVVVKISDSGHGISKEALDQIWDPFFTTKSTGQGLGLGLAITYNIIKRHGGEISVASIVGEGSTFTVRIPLCQK